MLAAKPDGLCLTPRALCGRRRGRAAPQRPDVLRGTYAGSMSTHTGTRISRYKNNNKIQSLLQIC